MVKLGLSLSLIFLASQNVVTATTWPQAERTVEVQAQEHLRQAKAAEAINDPEAERHYRLAIQLRGGRYPRAAREFSWYLQRKLRFSEGATFLDDYIRQTPDKNHENDEKELADLQRAATLQNRISTADKPNLADLTEFVNLVSVYAGNQFKDARPYAEQAVRLYPRSSEAYVSLAIAMIGSDAGRRRELLHKASDLDPNNAEAHRWLGWEYNQQGLLKEAAGEYHRALEVSRGELGEAWRGLGEVMMAQGNHKEALEAFRNYLKSGKAPPGDRSAIEEKIKQLQRMSHR